MFSQKGDVKIGDIEMRTDFSMNSSISMEGMNILLDTLKNIFRRLFRREGGKKLPEDKK